MVAVSLCNLTMSSPPQAVSVNRCHCWSVFQRPAQTFGVVVAANLGLSVVWWFVIDAMTSDGVDYNFGLWVVPVLCLFFTTAGVSLLGVLDIRFRRSAAGALLALPVVALVDVAGLVAHILAETGST